MLKAIITRVNKNLLCFIKDNEKVIEIHDFEKSIIGNIYLARVQNYVTNLDSAFIDIGDKSGVYLHEPKIDNVIDGERIRNGCMYLCQIKKDKRKGKTPEVKSKLDINGKHTVITFGDYGIRVSKKIRNSSKIRDLLKIGHDMKRTGYSIVFRTSSYEESIENIENDIRDVFKKFDTIFNKAKYMSNPGILYEKKDYVFERLNKVDEIVTDDAEIYNEMKEKYSNIRYYQDDYSILSVNSLNKTIDEIKKKIVHINNGANIVIEKTEALTVIDVNSAKAITGKSIKNDIKDINIAAAKESIRQIMIRNISGIILIDFINMVRDDERKEVIETIKKELSRDYTSSVVYGFTKLGLLELSRKRIKDSITELI